MTDTLLVTGATGLLGSSLVPFLRACSCYHVITQARAGSADFLVDLADKKEVINLLNQVKPSIIVNLVSLTDVEFCQQNLNMAYLANTRTVENLACWISNDRAGCYLLQISTDHVYDGVGRHVEDDVTLINNYAFSKYAGELAASRVPSAIIRTNFIGRSKVQCRQSITDWIYLSLVNEEKSIQVLDDVFFSPLSMITLAKMIHQIVQKKLLGIFNLGSRNGMSKADFVFEFASYLQLSTEKVIRIHSEKANFLKTVRPKNMRMDCTKIENEMGIVLPAFEDEIKLAAREYYAST